METVNGDNKDAGKGFFGFGEVISFAHFTGIDQKIFDQLKPVLDQIRNNPELKAEMKKLSDDLKIVQERLTKIESQEEKNKQAELAIDILKKKYAVCMCEKSSIPCCFKWLF